MYARMAAAMIKGMPKLSAIWADAMDARTDAQPFTDQAKDRWTGLFKRNAVLYRLCICQQKRNDNNSKKHIKKYIFS